MSANPRPSADTVTIEVDGKNIEARKGEMLIQATDAAGIYIPRFCYHNKLSIAANCRMCLVEVEKAPKPLPACATPVTEGMVVKTRSDYAKDAQRGTMEFLLINHPLDCPVCDQGGECPLQDQAMGYGKDISRFNEGKRVVKDKYIGPLIETEMTRCIHCTRCVRFGKEVAGIMELGAPGRGEHMEISTYVANSVDSELSGNMIDICPVGALTSKPYRFTARPWELISHPGISPHDCLGTNINIQTLRNKVKRVLPVQNETINETWISDRDRFSYTAINTDDRLQRPMIKKSGQWMEVDWETALEYTAYGLHNVIGQHGAEQLGALAHPAVTLEEFFLLQKLTRTLGSHNVDHRLYQTDFSDDENAPLYPTLGQAIQDLEKADAILLIGSNLRKEQPLLGARVRKAANHGATISAINPVDYDYAFPVTNKLIGDLPQTVTHLAAVVKALGELTKTDLNKYGSWLAKAEGDDTARAIAKTLYNGQMSSILLGHLALSHPQAAAIKQLARLAAQLAHGRLGQLPPANSVAGWLAGCVPHRESLGKPDSQKGLTLNEMLATPRKAYLLLGLEPELDCIASGTALKALQQAEFVVMLSSYKPNATQHQALQYADVLLPTTPFTENEGTFVNIEGRSQTFRAATPPLAEAKPAWKVLRVLAEKLGITTMAYNSITEIHNELPISGLASSWPHEMETISQPQTGDQGTLQRIAEQPIYAVDAIVRRAAPLQATHDNPKPALRLNSRQAQALQIKAGDHIQATMETGHAHLEVVLDDRIADGCTIVSYGHAETSTLSGHGTIAVSRD